MRVADWLADAWCRSREKKGFVAGGFEEEEEEEEEEEDEVS